MVASSAQGISYFERDGYYAKDDPAHKEASAWAGKGAEELGLSGPVNPEAFRAVLEGKVLDGPQLGRAIRPGAAGNRNERRQFPARFRPGDHGAAHACRVPAVSHAAPAAHALIALRSAARVHIATSGGPTILNGVSVSLLRVTPNTLKTKDVFSEHTAASQNGGTFTMTGPATPGGVSARERSRSRGWHHGLQQAAAGVNKPPPEGGKKGHRQITFGFW